MPVEKIFLNSEIGDVVIRHTPMIWGTGSIIFLHGLGDSRQCFKEAFEHERLQSYNLIAPDFPGSGNSDKNDEVSIATLIHCAEAIIAKYKVPECILVGHGLGADIATWLSQRSGLGTRIKGIINIEGTIGEENLRFADMAIDAAKNPKKTFYKWFKNDFAEQYILIEHVQKHSSYRRYHESLILTKHRTFLTLSREMREKLYVDEFSKEVQAYKAFKELEIPKYYCYGENGFSKSNAHKLDEDEVPNLLFPASTHWVMIDEAVSFYAFLSDFCAKHMPQPPVHIRMRNWFTVRFREWLKTLPNPLSFFQKIKRWCRQNIKY